MNMLANLRDISKVSYRAELATFTEMMSSASIVLEDCINENVKG